MLGLFSFFFLFIFPTGVLKCKRASAYSRWRWCRGGKGLQWVREFHSHHPSFPLGKAWICARVCGKKKKKVFCVRVSVSNFLSSGYTIPTSWHTFPASSGQICFCPRASAAATLPPLQKKKVGAVGEECVFSLRVALHERFQTGNNHPRHKERALLSLLGGVARDELKDWNLVMGTNRQRKRTRCLRERSIFFPLGWTLSECI